MISNTLAEVRAAQQAEAEAFLAWQESRRAWQESRKRLAAARAAHWAAASLAEV